MYLVHYQFTHYHPLVFPHLSFLWSLGQLRYVTGYVFAISTSNNHCSSFTSYMKRWWIRMCGECVLFSLAYQHQIANINLRWLCLRLCISMNFHFSFYFINFSFDFLRLLPVNCGRFILNLPVEQSLFRVNLIVQCKVVGS